MPSSNSASKPCPSIERQSLATGCEALRLEKLNAQRIRSPFQVRSNARTGSLDSTKAISPRTRAGRCLRQAKNLRKACRTEPGSLSCSFAARAKCSGGIGSHGLAVVNPPFGSADQFYTAATGPSAISVLKRDFYPTCPETTATTVSPTSSCQSWPR